MTLSSKPRTSQHPCDVAQKTQVHLWVALFAVMKDLTEFSSARCFVARTTSYCVLVTATAVDSR